MLDPQTRRARADRVRYYNELGIYDFYRRESNSVADTAIAAADEPASRTTLQPEEREEMPARKSTAAARAASMPTDGSMFEVLATRPEQRASDPAEALKIIKDEIGSCCTRC